MAVHGRGLLIGQPCRRHDEGWHMPPTGHVYDVGHHGGGGRSLARAAALEHGLADEIALDRYSVEYAFDVGDRRLERDHAGVHALLDAVFGLTRQAQKL